ncbi:MAG TPA: D-glycero-beta-D-manno-heptose 1-phosphate adenylyltransferase [Chitinophagaceae bacterium]|nr:D-glycero-beta-D-manno-heptose 1-phosphate adenylyltransferase [Chitinophagaceae bacterium]
MKRSDTIPQKIFQLPELVRRTAQWRMLRKKIVFTNGVFDIIHPGHIFSLSEAAKEADYLVVGLNSDTSVKRLKGDSRPFNDQQSRALQLAALLMVDAVVIFEEDTPLELIKTIMPDVLVKGGDYTIDKIAGAKEVIANGGRVVINKILEGFSTTSLIDKMKGN